MPFEYFKYVLLPERFGWTYADIDAMPLYQWTRLMQLLEIEGSIP